MQLTIKSLNHQGLGVAHHDGKTIFVHGALPGETVIAAIKQRHARYDVAETTEVLQASDDRVTPVCPHFQLCGGCALQHMSSDAQINLKQQVLLEQLSHFAQVSPSMVLPPLTSASEGYRRKARLGVKFVEKKNKLLVGFREHNNRYLADLNSCSVLIPKIGKSFDKLRDTLMQLSDYRSIAQVELAAGDKVIALIFRHLKPLTDNDLEVFTDYGKSENIHIYLQPKGPDTVHRIWPLHTDEVLSYTTANMGIPFHPLDFVQVNKEINEKMVSRTLSELALLPSDNVLDLFSGLGNFTLPIAKLAKSVVGVEGSNEMVKRLVDNAKLHQLNNVTAFMADLTQPIHDFPWAKQTYTKIVLDPPRTGALEIAQQIGRFQAEKIVYISCHVATLARDTKVIIEQGYRLEKAGVMDMFPHTMHVESMAVFVRR